MIYKYIFIYKYIELMEYRYVTFIHAPMRWENTIELSGGCSIAMLAYRRVYTYIHIYIYIHIHIYIYYMIGA